VRLKNGLRIRARSPRSMNMSGTDTCTNTITPAKIRNTRFDSRFECQCPMRPLSNSIHTSTLERHAVEGPLTAGTKSHGVIKSRSRRSSF